MSSPQLSGYRSYDHGAGAYGRDGAPASNFMASPPPAHRYPSPQRLNIAPSERPLPPIARYSPTPSSGSRRTPSPHQNPFASPHDPRPSPPKAAFLEPSPVNNSDSDFCSPHGLIHGESEKLRSPDNFYKPVARLQDLKRPTNEEESSAWLKKQAQAGSKFKTATWVVATVSLIIIVGLIGKIVTHKSPAVTSPTPLNWANGASDIPTFGANSTSHTNQSQSSHSTADPKSSSLSSSTSRKRRSLHLLD